MDASLGQRELDVMGVLWRDGPGTVEEVRERLAASLARTTVLTILRNLEAKGFVGHEAEGRVHRYHAEVEADAVRGSFITRMVTKLFGGSAAHAATHLVADERLSADDLRELQRLIDERLRVAEGAASPARAKRSNEASSPKRTSRRGGR